MFTELSLKKMSIKHSPLKNYLIFGFTAFFTLPVVGLVCAWFFGFLALNNLVSVGLVLLSGLGLITGFFINWETIAFALRLGSDVKSFTFRAESALKNQKKKLPYISYIL